MNINTLQPIPNRHLPIVFAKAVKMLMRPYHPLTHEQVKYVESITERVDTDILQDENGNQYTWGLADGCMQLMPIQEQYKYR